jgi:hypothetical protein
MNASPDKLISDVVALAIDLLSRPLANPRDTRERSEALRAQVEEAIANTTSFGIHLDNGTPFLLDAIDKVLLKRQVGDREGAAVWEGVVGHMLPIARQDGGKALEMSREVLTERPTR